ncbi:MAG: hydroxymethylbilane synthase [Rhodobacteraceae bacterium]|nr:MAG: hydroxymethylbilane synthase [Paracoccaceae bacterium]
MTHQLPSPDAPLKIGTRGSLLALAQAHETRDRIAAAFDLPQAAFEIVPITTTGDNRALIASDTPLKALGGKGLFTKEVEDALIAGEIDIAVHSMKDMPVVQPAGLVLDCYLPREDVRDSFISPVLSGIADLPAGAVVGTSSLRRRAQLLSRRPDLEVVQFRGNVQTRLKKLADGVASCTFLAMAGLTRLRMLDEVPAHPIATEDMLPAIAQGAIGVERREGDTATAALLEPLHDRVTGQRLAAERAFLAALDGSCETPIAGLALLEGGEVYLQGEILRPDGSEVLADAGRAPIEDGARLGHEMGKRLLAQAGPGFFSFKT